MGETGDFSRRDREHSKGNLFMDKIYAAALANEFVYCLRCFVVNLHSGVDSFRSSVKPNVFVLVNEEDFAFRNLLEALFAAAMGMHVSYASMLLLD